MAHCDSTHPSEIYPTVDPVLRTTPKKCFEKCNKCYEELREGVEYRGTVWHKQCLTCTNCQEILAGTKFTHVNDNPFCFHCFGKLHAHKCTFCSRPIYGLGEEFLVYMEGRRWHVACFKCVSCEATLLGEISYVHPQGAMCQGCAQQHDLL